jgi:phosphatidylglycerophosphate synthase
MCTDLLDGFLARKLMASTNFGRVIDLVSDKSMTIVSLLYAAARGIDVLPLALIAVRDLIMLGARIIVVGDRQLLPTSKIVGGLMALLVWGNTLFLVFSRDSYSFRIANRIYWVCALVLIANLITRIYVSTRRIIDSMHRRD